MERRSSLRLKKNLECVLYTQSGEYNARVVDISSEGIAFEATSSLGLAVGDRLSVTICEEYLDVSREQQIYTGNVMGLVRNISQIEETRFRFGCMVNDVHYSEYLQEQYIAFACGIESNTGD